MLGLFIQRVFKTFYLFCKAFRLHLHSVDCIMLLSLFIYININIFAARPSVYSRTHTVYMQRNILKFIVHIRMKCVPKNCWYVMSCMCLCVCNSSIEMKLILAYVTNQMWICDLFNYIIHASLTFRNSTLHAVAVCFMCAIFITLFLFIVFILMISSLFLRWKLFRWIYTDEQFM